MPRLAQVTRIKILEEVSVHHKKVSAVCKKWGISRYTFYAWAKDYASNKLIPDKTVRGIKHHSYIKGSKERYILDLVLKNPVWTLRQIANYLEKDNGGKYKTSLHGIANVLARNGLKDLEARRNFASRHPVKTTIAQRFSDFEKYKAIEDFLQKKEKVSAICRKYRISRFTFYSWLRRYSEDQTVSSLSGRRSKGESHWRYVGEAVKKQVLDAVISSPTYSVHMLHAHLAGAASHHAVQNILARENLNTLEKRQAYAAGYMPEPKVQVARLYEVPVPKLSVWRLLFAPFKTVPKWIIKHPISWPVVLPSIVFLAYIFEVDKAFKPTVFFPLIALTFGFFFFLYSMKYYISLIIVMRISQKGAGSGEQKKKGRIVSILEKYFKLGSARISRVDPLLLNLDKVELARQPFVSIHLAIYNEKRVVSRLIEACQNQEWGNYEVILADDSTDETTEIAKEILAKDGRILIRSLADENLEIYISTPPVGSSLPVIKLIHRFSRDGFKGAALQKALENTNPRAEYISVFDSDFVPFPDTISQFVKMFQESCGSLDNVRDSNIAAVQGYQWHVLNKSQNWVTRGVRSEYAGNYVIERAGIGIYGGLNMIAGSVFCIRADLLRAFAWGTSITEDFELTLRLYERGYKVLFTPYIQAPAEAVSTVRRLIRQRMRWAEGHTFNIRKMAGRILSSPYVSRREKSEFIYLAPYYLQAAFFIVGTLAWFFSEAVLKVRLPFWTAAWGWSLVFVNFLALPLMNLVGLFLEESEERDYLGIASFLVLSYILVPFQAYAAVKALLEDSEGPWFRTPKTGNITDAFDRMHIYNWLERLKIWPMGKTSVTPAQNSLSLSNMRLSKVFVPNLKPIFRRKRQTFFIRSFVVVLLIVSIVFPLLSYTAPQSEATNPSSTTWHMRDENVGNSQYGRATYCVSATDCKIAYSDATTPDIKFIDCDNATCTVNTTNILGAAVAMQYVSLYCVATDNCKIAAYYDSSTAKDLIILDCGDSTCDSGNAGFSSFTPDTTGDVGQYTSIYCLSDTDCKVSYYDVTNGNLKFIDCNNKDCSSAGTPTTVDSTGDVGKYTSITCPATDDCKISYYDATNGDLKFADCDTATCSTSQIDTVDSTNDIGQYSSIQCASATDCSVAYYDVTNTALKHIRCLDDTGDGDSYPCNAAGERAIAIIDGNTGCPSGCTTTASVGQYASYDCRVSFTICRIAYYDSDNGNLKFVACTGTCGGLSSFSSPDTGGDVGQYVGIYCLAGTDCKVSYYDVTNGDLKFRDCNAANCSSGTTLTLDGNKIINNTLGASTTTKTIGSSVSTYTLVSNQLYPTGGASGSLGTGTYTMHLEFTNALTGTMTWRYRVGYCTVSDNCATKTVHVTSADQNYTSSTTSPQNVTVTAGSALEIPGAQQTKWIYVDIDVTAAGGGSITVRENNTHAATADSYIDVPALTVPEFIGFLVPAAPFLPRVVSYIKDRLRRRRKVKRCLRPPEDL